jgi:acyl carrier protein
MITESEARQRLTRTLAEILVLNEDEVHPGSKLVDDLDADSIAFLELNHRLQSDFGLEVPRPKVTEETLGLPLREGLAQLEALGVEATLLEFMTQETLRQARQDLPACDLLAEQFGERLIAEEFRRDLESALARAAGDPAQRQALGALLPALQAVPVLAPGLERFLAAHPEPAAAWRALAAENPAGGPAPVSALWRRAFGQEPVRRSLDAISVGQLAGLMATAVPVGMDPDLPIGRLQVRELFRFITVASYVHYILFLARTQEARAAAQAAKP